MRKTESILRTDTAEVRVTEWRLLPGDGTGVHRHKYDCVVVPLTRGTLRLVAGTEPLAFVDIELKDRPG